MPAFGRGISGTKILTDVELAASPAGDLWEKHELLGGQGMLQAEFSKVEGEFPNSTWAVFNLELGMSQEQALPPHQRLDEARGRGHISSS